MSIIGSIFSFDCKTFTCFKRITRVNTNDDDYDSIYQTAQQSNILILPATNIQTLKSLFPESNHVHLFNVLIVGKEKEYILCKLQGDFQFQGHEKLMNAKYADRMPTEIRKLLDGIWDKTLGNKNLQFLMVFRGKAYLCNSFSFKNSDMDIIGAICFIRNIELVQETSRLSVDRQNQMDTPMPIPIDHLATLLENRPQ